MSFSAYYKDPEAEEDIYVDWRRHLGNDVIQDNGSTWPVLPPSTDIEVVSTTVDADKKATILKVRGGTHMRAYRFVNRIRTQGQRTHEWVLVVYVEEVTVFADGPPWVTLRDATAYVPGALGAAPVKVQTDLNRAADWVSTWAPRPYPSSAILLGGLSAGQNYVPVPRTQDFNYEGIVRVNNEILRYFGKETLSGVDSGDGQLTRVQRGQFATNAAEHPPGSVMEDYEYNVRAQNAVKSLFEWIWQTRGFRPSRSGQIGSESYSADMATAKALVRQDMGHFYTGGGRIEPARIHKPVPRVDHDLGILSPWRR